MKKMKSLVRDLLPHAVVRILKQVYCDDIRYEGEFDSWKEASTLCTGYDSEDILAKVLASTLKVKRGEAVFERDSVLFDKTEYVWPVLTGLLWAATRNNGKLNVLDFGGALGSSYFQNRNLFKSLQNVRWNVVEQDHYVDAGRAHIQDDVLRFYKSIDECLTENIPNVILLSGVLQYLKSPLDIIKQLPDIKASTLIIDRTSFSICNKDKLMIQRVPASIYKATYPMWVFSEPAFMEQLLTNWNLVASTPSPEGSVISANGFRFLFHGLLLESH